jgi:precorrin-2/cobalt-factor-2 C20-methyltransferase
MSTGTFFGVGVGPGDPELVTVKGAGVIARCAHVFVPKARIKTDSVALNIARRYISRGAAIHELVFPMTKDSEELESRWQDSAGRVADVLRTGTDACFLTLGDPLLYSTYVYLLRAVRALLPELSSVTVPGITSFCAAAALTDFTLGEAKDPITIVPTSDDLTAVRNALGHGGTVVLMKIGERLRDILSILRDCNLIRRAVLVSRAGQPDQRIVTDLTTLGAADSNVGYLSVILVHAGKGRVSGDEGSRP